MKNNYYTPKIEEFYVGFECEMKNSSDPVHFDWEPCIFRDDFSNQLSEDYCFEYLIADLRDKNIRVKYLDREDIESLGFRYLKDGWGDNSKIFRSIKREGHEIYYRGYGSCHITSESGAILFEGTAKNKSELKKLLGQLGIE